MKKLFVLLFLLVLSQALFSGNYSVEKDYTVKKGEIREKSLISLDGNIKIMGRVKGSVLIFSGKLELDGIIEEDLVVVGTEFTFTDNARIMGDLIYIGRDIESKPSRVEGEVFYSRFDLKKIESSIFPLLSEIKSDNVNHMLVNSVKAVVWLLIILLIFSFFNKTVVQAYEETDGNYFKVLLYGIVSVTVLLVAGVIFILLSFIYIGIPLIICTVLIYVFLLFLGRTVLVYTIGNKILNVIFSGRNISSSYFIAAGVFVFFALRFIPYAGLFFTIIFSVAEIGVASLYVLNKKFRK